MYNFGLFLFMRFLEKHRFHWLRLDEEAVPITPHNWWVRKAAVCSFPPIFPPWLLVHTEVCARSLCFCMRADPKSLFLVFCKLLLWNKNQYVRCPCGNLRMFAHKDTFMCLVKWLHLSGCWGQLKLPVSQSSVRGSHPSWSNPATQAVLC